jgi:8-oxo-dGTP pyrophosphatase MutT (NUDIX family)
MLFGEGVGGPDVLLIRRALSLRSHAGQPAFPGGAQDPTDGDLVTTALREANEETGLDPACVHVFGTLPPLYVPISDFAVTPVLGWWRQDCPVGVVDPAEVASVHRVPIDALLDPAVRVLVRHPSGYIGPGFDLPDLLVWGFTAGLLDEFFLVTGWARPCVGARVVDLPASDVRAARRTYDPASGSRPGED